MKQNSVKKVAMVLAIMMLPAMSVTACSKTASPSASASQSTAISTTAAVSQSEAPEASSESAISKEQVGKKRIIFVAKKLDSTFWTDMQEGINKACQQYGWTVETLCPTTRDDIKEQTQLIEQSLFDPPDAYIIGPADGVGIAPAIKEINAANIPIIIVDTKVEDTSVKTNCFVGAQFDYIATECGKEMGTLLNGKGNVLILEGTSGQSTSVDIYNGFLAGLSATPDVKVLDHQIANWNRLDGLAVTQNLLQKYSDVDAILASNLEMALGACIAIKQANRTGIKVGTINMSKEAVQYLQDSQLTFIADDRSDLVGEAAVERCMDFFRGIPLPEKSKIDCTIVTKDNLESAGYLKKYGLK